MLMRRYVFATRTRKRKCSVDCRVKPGNEESSPAVFQDEQTGVVIG
jgi:hypothetical protein